MSHTSYLFNIGNSDSGPLGLCARVCAETPEEALKTLRERVPFANTLPTSPNQNEYIAVYVNTDSISVDDLLDDEEEDCECDDYD